MERDCSDLAQTRKLRSYEPPGSGPDVTLHTSHAGVRRILVGRIFRGHHGVTRGAAETRRIHVFNAAIRSCTNDQEVDHRGEAYPLQGPANDWETKVDGRVDFWQISALKQASPPEPDSDRNQQ